MERETEKIVEYLDGEQNRIFVVKKMNPLDGIAVLYEIMTKVLPMDLLSDMDGVGQITSMFANIPKKEMSVEDFVKLERRLLSHAYEKLKSGEVKVIDSAGNYRVSNLGNNMFLNAYLMLKVIEVNYKDFFLEILRRFETFGEKKKKMEEMEKTQQVMAEQVMEVLEKKIDEGII